MEHKTELDGAGWHNRPRLTCYTCDNATLVRQPYMTMGQWIERVAEFAIAHPSETTTNYKERVSNE